MIRKSPLLEKSIRTRFLSMLFVLAIVFIIILSAFFLHSQSMNRNFKENQEAITEKAQIVNRLSDSLNDIFFRARGYYSFQDKNELDLLYKSLADFKKYLNQYAELPLSDDEEKLYNDLLKFSQNYEAVILPQALSYVDTNDYSSLRELSSSGVNNTVNEFVSYTKEYQEKNQIELEQLFIRLIEKERNYNIISLIIIVLVFIVVGIIMRKIISKLIQPIEQLTVASNEIVAGQFINLDSLIDKKDELGVLANSFYRMTQFLQEKEEMLMAQNEELLAQQSELVDNKTQLQQSLGQLEKYNQLNQSLTFTLNKQELLKNLHDYLHDLYKFDTSIMYLMDNNVYVSKGLSHQTTEQLVRGLEQDKQIRLKEEKNFIIKREINQNNQVIAQAPYYCYDLYSAVINSVGQLEAILIATREGYRYTNLEIDELSGLLNRSSIAFERINMFEEVERSRQLNKKIIDTVNEGIQLISINGDLMLINEALFNMIIPDNQLREKIIPQHIWLEYFQNVCDQPEKLISYFSAAINEDFIGIRTFRYSISEPNSLFIEVYATSVHEKGKKTGTMFVHRDITKEYEVDQMKSELVSTVSHELRTPLSSVLGFTELLLAKEVKPERQKKYIETIHKEAVRLTNLINDFLDLQRMESGKQSYNMEPLMMNELLIEMVNRFSHEKNHRVHLVDKAKYVNIMGDPERLTQALINIIGNAIKFSPEGGDVTITLENINGMVQVSIKDHGVGIPKNEMSKLFQKFMRIDNTASRKIGGTGLGLAITKEIIKEHNGEIWIESEEGKGTTILFNIPLNKKCSSRNSFQDNDNSDLTKLNVMIVEDDFSLALLLSEEIKNNDFTVIYHDNPNRAFEEALKTPLVGIVIDLMLGDELDGWGLIKKLKETEQTSHIPIIVSSALDESKELVEKYKVDRYLTKPYSPEELSKILIAFVQSSDDIENSNTTF